MLGIDPGLAATGVGLVEGRFSRIQRYAFGTVETSPKSRLPWRLARIFSRIRQLLEEQPPDLMVIEDIFSLPAYPKSGILLGKVSGVILLAGARAGVPVIEVPVREAKQVLTGNGNADKCQLEGAVRRFVGHQTPITPDHASDALALALIGLFRYGKPS